MFNKIKSLIPGVSDYQGYKQSTRVTQQNLKRIKQIRNHINKNISKKECVNKKFKVIHFDQDKIRELQKLSQRLKYNVSKKQASIFIEKVNAIISGVGRITAYIVPGSGLVAGTSIPILQGLNTHFNHIDESRDVRSNIKKTLVGVATATGFYFASRTASRYKDQLVSLKDHVWSFLNE